jgi:hypothetical protein
MDFLDVPAEFTGSLISMEFGPGGRIAQLWASDPNLAEEGEEFQFVLPPIQFGDESADDYLPGTILIGVRTGPRDPWVLDRNKTARQLEETGDEEPPEPAKATFEYEFPLLEEFIDASGKFYEIPGPLPQVVWDVEIRNRSRRSVEIGELGFPLAFNNFYDGFGWSDDALQKLWQSRVYIHKFIGGAASWVFAQRMNAEAPGLLVYPGEKTGWEFYSHVRASLNTPYQWEGIPVVYVHSKATMEREEWPAWMNDHTSVVLEPRDTLKVQLRFVPAESDRQDGVGQALQTVGKPVIRSLPGCVAPLDVGIGLEVQNASPDRFFISRDAEVEVDSEEDNSFCFVRPKTPGPLSVSFVNKEGVPSSAHLLFIEPIRDLIRKRAEWIAAHQLVQDKEKVLDQAIVLTNIATFEKSVDPAEYVDSSGIECSLADALFLAEKNAIYPETGQIQVLDDYLKDFLLDDVQNPSSFAVASVLTGGQSIGAYYGRPLGYPHVFNLYHSMYRIASTYGNTRLTAKEYLEFAACTALAMFEQGWRFYVRTVGVLGFARIYDLVDDLQNEGMAAYADQIEECVQFKAEELVKMKYPFAGESVMDTSGFEEVFAAARFLADDEHLERTVRCAYASRSLAPSWWWYGGDKRCYDGIDSTPVKAMVDRGEACLAHTTIPNSMIFFGLMDRDYLAIPEAYLRMAFGGMIGPWALVRTDGAASMCYCPDNASRQAGFNVYTGASGLGYFHYLRGVGSYVLPNRTSMFIFGCHYDFDNAVHVIRPWDGVGRRIVLRQIGVEFQTSFGCVAELRLDERLRWFSAVIENPSDRDIETEVLMQGLWGGKVEVGKQKLTAERGKIRFRVKLAANGPTEVSGKVLPG